MASPTTDVLDLAYGMTGPVDGSPVLVHGWPDAARGLRFSAWDLG